VTDRNYEPRNWDEYINQEPAKSIVKRALEASQRRGEPLDHVLIHGPSGLGKSAMAKIIAGGNLRVVYGQNYLPRVSQESRKEKPPMLPLTEESRLLLGDYQFEQLRRRHEYYDARSADTPPSYLFIDEIHTVPAPIQETLLEALDKHTEAQTVIAATTRPDLLITPLRNRFVIEVRVDFYSEDSLTRILVNMAQAMDIRVQYDGLRLIASRSRGVPREAKNLLKRVRDFGDHLTLKDIRNALLSLGVDHLGLKQDERAYMMSLANDYGGGPTAIATLSSRLSVARETLITVTEQYLLRAGLVEITGQGRQLTAKGRTYVAQVAQCSSASQYSSAVH